MENLVLSINSVFCNTLMMSRQANIMHEQLHLVGGSPIKIKQCNYDYFKYPYHFHMEYEIAYIHKGYGTLYAGNSINSFDDDFLVLFGSNYPHMFKSHQDFYDQAPKLRTHAIIIHFQEDFLKDSRKYYPEFNSINQLLTNSQYGATFGLKGNEPLREKVRNIPHATGLKRLIELIDILYLMGQSANVSFLGQQKEKDLLTTKDERLVKVLSKINTEYHKEIHLEEIAEIAGMNPSAFSRYFKQKTSKTLTRYINELRVNYACELLIEERLSISQIAYECGFNNISNFNRQFRNITSFNPSDYVKKFSRNISQNEKFKQEIETTQS